MKKLKTLKDIQDETHPQSVIDSYDVVHKIKQAAQEWIDSIDDYRWSISKNPKNPIYKHPKLKKAIDDDYYHCQVIEEWIKYFFNLEDE